MSSTPEPGPRRHDAVGIPAHTLCFAQLNQLIEPNDLTATALLELMSPAELLALIHREDHVPSGLESGLAQLTGRQPEPNSAQDLRVSLTRWRKRLPYANAHAALESIARLGGGLLSRQDPGWPAQLDDLGFARPLCLWWRAGSPHWLHTQRPTHTVSVVGSRDASDYGNQVTVELARALGRQGITVVSGGAYGIDAAAHRAALATGEWDFPNPPTIAILAGGADRLYPAGNHTLLEEVIARGVLYSEVPPGSTPTRFRFLNRNRLIAAYSRLTIVTEARHRSGALNTAGHALELGREVAAVPGSVFSPNSAGTHRLIRASAAALLSSPADAVELLDLPADQVPGAVPADPADPRHYPADSLSTEQALLYDVLPMRKTLSPDELSARSGVSILQTLRGLSELERRGLAVRSEAGWKLVRG
ncbi:DNA-processing protein DprA [Glutamicibacter sp. NPDC087344]|uniref:DNA-processing protein DprA n=1 Tax=Glutamicibacter sp. NPDC087344 TaxID=3363994 RepID=UPI0038237A3F